MICHPPLDSHVDVWNALRQNRFDGRDMCRALVGLTTAHCGVRDNGCAFS